MHNGDFCVIITQNMCCFLSRFWEAFCLFIQKQKNTLQTIIVALVALDGLAASIFCLVWRLQNAIPAFSYVLIYFFRFSAHKKAGMEADAEED